MEKGDVIVGLNLQTKNIKADSVGKWVVYLNPEVAGGPFSLTVKGKNTIM